MATKTVEKNARPTQATPEEMQAAYQAHTLAQMLYGQLASRTPWPGATSLHGGVDPRLGACYGTVPGVLCGQAPWCPYGSVWLR
jgi:hypothetical protein